MRANMLQKSANAGRHSFVDRGFDCYPTPPEAVIPLIAAENLSHWIWEPCAGHGNIATVLRSVGHAVVASDAVRYSFPLHFVADFLTLAKAPEGVNTIVSNPPYRLAQEFIEHGLDLVPTVIMLLRLGFLESERRSPLLDGGSLARIHVFKNRLPMMHRDGWAGPRASSAIAFAWYVWSRDHRGPTTIDRISWRTP
jgi:hypothetical protein